MKYRCEATSVTGFIQILASNYLPHGYWFYVTGKVPPSKDPRLVDQKILAKYGIELSRQRYKRFVPARPKRSATEWAECPSSSICTASCLNSSVNARRLAGAASIRFLRIAELLPGHPV